MKVIVVIPAWNEERTIGEVVRSVVNQAKVVVVDDGSGDRTAKRASEAGALVIRHAANRGLGAALGTGIAAALRLGAEAIATMDADGQHSAEDLPAMFDPVLAGRAELVIGTRFSGKGHMPLIRRLANRVGNLVTKIFFGIRVSDSQSGFRAFSQRAARELIIRTDGMEVSSEIMAEAREKKWRLIETPIRAVYTSYSLSKGQGFFLGMRTLARLTIHWLKR